MYNTNKIVAGMIARLNGSSGDLHSDPTDNASTNGMIARTSGNKRNFHGYFANNENFSHCDLRNSASTDGKTEAVYVGKNQYHISIMKLGEVLEISWRKKVGLYMISSSMRSLSGILSVSDFITLMDNQVTMETYFALQDANKIRDMHSLFGVNNIPASAFNNASGKSSKTIFRNTEGKAIRYHVSPL